MPSGERFQRPRFGASWAGEALRRVGSGGSREPVAPGIRSPPGRTPSSGTAYRHPLRGSGDILQAQADPRLSYVVGSARAFALRPGVAGGCHHRAFRGVGRASRWRLLSAGNAIIPAGGPAFRGIFRPAFPLGREILDPGWLIETVFPYDPRGPPAKDVPLALPETTLGPRTEIQTWSRRGEGRRVYPWGCEQRRGKPGPRTRHVGPPPRTPAECCQRENTMAPAL